MFEIKRLQEVATFHNDRREEVRGSQRLLRRGPFFLYTETGTVPFDDYSYDGHYLIVGSLCNVENAHGCFAAQQAEGKFAVTPLYHVIAGEDDEDTAYLREILIRTPVRGRADTGAQSIRLSENSLRHVPLPWPDKEVRQAFLSFLEQYQQREQELRAAATQATEKGLKALRTATQQQPVEATLGELCHITPGRSLDASLRNPSGRFPVVSSQGVMGFTDEEGMCGPCFVVGQAGQFLLGALREDGAFPLADSLALTLREEAPLSMDTLAFALMEAGIRPHLRIRDHQVDALAAPLDHLEELRIVLPPAAQLEQVEQETQAAMTSLRSLESERSALAKEFSSALRLFLEADERALDAFAAFEGDLSAGKPSSLFSKKPTPHETAAPSFARLGNADDVLNQAWSLVEQALRFLQEDLTEATCFDAVWEAIPLLVARALTPLECWQEMAQSSFPAQQADDVVRRAANKTLVDLDVEEILGSNSMLGGSQRNSLVRALASWPDERRVDIGQIIRLLANSVAIDGQLPRTPLPSTASSVSSLEGFTTVRAFVTDIAKALRPQATGAFDPHADSGSLLACLSRAMPETALFGESDHYSQVVAAALASLCEAEQSALLKCSNALLDNSFGDEQFDIVASVLPCNYGEWTPCAVNSEDPRWQFGNPPRNKANLAWLQHAYYHRAPQGIAVLAVANAVLHESRGCEPSLRQALIESGCLYAVVSLPGRLLSETPTPMSILVLDDKRASDTCETLFVNLLEQGVTVIDAVPASTENSNEVKDPWTPNRLLPESAAKETAKLIAAWHRGQALELPSFARSVGKRVIAEHGVLTPWTYTS